MRYPHLLFFHLRYCRRRLRGSRVWHLINRAAREAAERPGPRVQPHTTPEGWGAPQPAGTPVSPKDDRRVCDRHLITSPNILHCPVAWWTWALAIPYLLKENAYRAEGNLKGTKSQLKQQKQHILGSTLSPPLPSMTQFCIGAWKWHVPRLLCNR